MPIFRVKSVKKTPLFRVKSVENANFSRKICKNLHRPKKIYTGIPVAPVTNMRYGYIRLFQFPFSYQSIFLMTVVLMIQLPPTMWSRHYHNNVLLSHLTAANFHKNSHPNVSHYFSLTPQCANIFCRNL